MSAYTDWDAFIEGQKQRLSMADVEAIQRGKRNHTGLAAEMRAGVYVWTAAALERFITGFFVQSTVQINSLAVPASGLRRTLLTLACDQHFHVIRSGNVRAAWQSRLGVFEMIDDARCAVLATTGGPLDGRTIRAYHFESLWSTFGLPGTPWPTPVHRAQLEDLAGGRNKIAHGEIDPVTFGRGRTFSDCRRILERVDEIVIHAVLTMDEYIHKALYMR